MASKITLQKKISVTKLCGKTSAIRVAKAPNGELPCGRFIGSASGIKSGQSDFGPWVALTGVFRGINTDTGEQMDSGTLFLPDVAHSMIAGQLASGALSVDFAFDIIAVVDEDSTVGFSYRAVPLIDQEGGNPIDRIQAKLLALAAPKEDTKDEAPAESKGKAKK